MTVRLVCLLGRERKDELMFERIQLQGSFHSLSGSECSFSPNLFFCRSDIHSHVIYNNTLLWTCQWMISTKGGTRTWKAGGAGSRLDGRRRQGGPIIGCLRPPRCLLEVDVQLLPVLMDTYTGDTLHNRGSFPTVLPPCASGCGRE